MYNLTITERDKLKDEAIKNKKDIITLKKEALVIDNKINLLINRNTEINHIVYHSDIVNS